MTTLSIAIQEADMCNSTKQTVPEIIQTLDGHASRIDEKLGDLNLKLIRRSRISSNG